MTKPVILDDGRAYSDRTIGGTAMSAIMGVNPWEQPHDIWLRLTGKAEPKQETEPMRLGKRYEPIVAEMFAGANPEYTVRHNFSGTDTPCRVVDPEYDFLTGSPDRIIFRDDEPVAGWEGKTANIHNLREWGESGTNEVPAHYLAQCLHYMGLTGLKDWRLSVLFLDDAEPVMYRSYNIKHDDETWNAMRHIAVSFWTQYVETNTPPPIEHGVGATTIQYYQQQFPADVNPIEDANSEEIAAMAAVIDAQTELEVAKNQFEALKADMMRLIGNRAGLRSNLGKITWKKSKDRETVDWKNIAVQLGATPDIIEENTTVSPGSRRFLVSPVKFG